MVDTLPCRCVASVMQPGALTRGGGSVQARRTDNPWTPNVPLSDDGDPPREVSAPGLLVSHPAGCSPWCRLWRMTTWPTHRARARWRRQRDRWQRRQQMLARRAARSGKRQPSREARA